MNVATTWRRLAVLMFAVAAPEACSSSLNQSSGTSAAPTRVSANAPSLSLVTPQIGHWAHYRVDSGGRSVDVYVAHDLEPKPLLVFLQGSGCAPLMTVDADGTFHDTSLFQDLITPRLSRLHFAMVEKRGIGLLRFSAEMTEQDKVSAFERASRECSTEYLQNVTKQTRVDDILATIRALTGQSWARHVILAGHSEGTHVATGVLRRTSEIAAAALFASAGPIPFYGGYVARGAGDRERFQAIFDRIRTLQNADDDFMYEGLPARRWKRFWLDSTPIEDARQHSASVRRPG